MEKQLFVLVGKPQRELAKSAIDMAPDNWCVELKRKTRTLDQNAKLWALLGDVSNQVDWYGNRLTADEWKDVFTAALKRQKTVPGVDGGFVVLGAHTSRMDKKEFSDLIEVIYAFGAEHGVEWSDKWMDRH